MESSPQKRSAEWWRKDAERNERARRARLGRDAAKSPDRNLEEGSELVRFAHEFSAAFEEAHPELAETAITARVREVPVAVCSRQHLVAMKRTADRPLDRADLEQLEEQDQ